MILMKVYLLLSRFSGSGTRFAKTGSERVIPENYDLNQT